jgi:UDP-glucose 4-epimerase
MTSVLVTGGAGFIGSTLVKSLITKGYDITVLDNFSTGYLENISDLVHVEIVRGDIRDRDLVNNLVKNADGIFHLAANVGNLKSIENPNEDSEINILGTLNLLNAAREHKVSKFVFSSSSAIFGEVVHLPLDEKHPAEPDSPYGVSKLAAEKHCLCYSKLYDMDIVCLRYFNVYGVNQRFNPYGNIIPIWTDCLIAGKPFTIYGDGEQTRDFINVDDIVQANIKSFESAGARGAFNIGSGKATTINQLAKIFMSVSGNDIELIYAPRRKGEVLHSKANISLAAGSFDFKPQISLEKGVEDYISWVRKS